MKGEGEKGPEARGTVAAAEHPGRAGLEFGVRDETRAG